MPRPDIRLIFSDFGGVICTFEYRIFCDRVARRLGRAPAEVEAAAFGDGLQEEFERGRLSGPAYHGRVMERLGAEIAYPDFFRLYGDIFSEIPATGELLRRLKRRYPLYLLSDTNEIHFGYVRQTVEVLRLFDGFVVSYEVGVLKPDPRIYQEALRRAGLPAEACVFVDDRPGNVAGAARLGIHALQFTTPEQVEADLERLGVAIR